MSQTKSDNAIEKIRQIIIKTPTQIPAKDSHEAIVHQWSQRELDALMLALGSKRPLLVRGEPGTGKTQLARAAAHVLGWELHTANITPRFEPSDLIYRFDAIKRLADAQAQHLQADQVYWEPGPLWKAYDWATACTYGSCRNSRSTAEPAGHVVLIDEIDKADSDLPNSLLEVLGQRTISITALGLEFDCRNRQPPLIVITTNEERELPPAFVRRCIVLHLEAEQDYAQWLLKRGKAHFGEAKASNGNASLSPNIMKWAARQLVTDREHVKAAGLPPPGLAEYIDLLRALIELADGDAARQKKLLRKLSAYAFIKHPPVGGRAELRQDRTPVSNPAAGR